MRQDSSHLAGRPVDPGTRGNVVRVFVVDDHSIVRHGLTSYLSITPGIEVAGDVCPQGAASAFGEHVEIAPRLGFLDDAEGIGLAGYRQVLSIVAGDLKKDPAIRPALIGLTRRMLKPRPVTVA